MTDHRVPAAHGVPALSAAKRLVWRALNGLPGDAATVDATLARDFAPDCVWHVGHPVEEAIGSGIEAALWTPLRHAFPDLERRCDIFIGGLWAIDGTDTLWIATTGHYLGRFDRPLYGIEPTGGVATLRFGEFYRVDPVAECIVECRVLLDFVDLMRQTGRPVLPPAFGVDGIAPAPRLHDGLLLDGVDPALGAESLARVEDMIFGGLRRFDGRDLGSMGMERFWRSDMLWCGPGGIGTTRTIAGFQQHHQAPFLHAFPDRVGGNHRARFGDGAFVASTGWPSVTATHAGDYLGVPATGLPITMRVMDWWSCRDGLLAENWIFIDLPHLMLQMGVDLFARMRTRSR